MAYLCASNLMIFLLQVGSFMRLNLKSLFILEVLKKFWDQKENIHEPSTILGLGSLATLLFIRFIKIRYSPRSLLLSLGPILVVTVGTLLNYYLKLSEKYEVKNISDFK